MKQMAKKKLNTYVESQIAPFSIDRKISNQNATMTRGLTYCKSSK